MAGSTNNIHLKQLECKSLKMNYIIIYGIEVPLFRGNLVARPLLEKNKYSMISNNV